MSAIEKVFNALSQLCEEKGNAYWALADTAREGGYKSTPEERKALHVAHGEHLAAIEALYLARKIYRIANAATADGIAEALRDAQAVIA